MCLDLPLQRKGTYHGTKLQPALIPCQCKLGVCLFMCVTLQQMSALSCSGLFRLPEKLGGFSKCLSAGSKMMTALHLFRWVAGLQYKLISYANI